MIPSEILTRARLKTAVDDTQYTDAEGLDDFNDLLMDFNQEVNNRHAMKYNWDYGKTDTVIGQSEYKVEEILISTGPDVYADVTKIDSVLLLVDGEYQRLKRIPESELSDAERAKTDILQYSIRDKSIFIFPTPTEVITDGIKVETQIMPNELTASGEINIPKQFHRIFLYGIIAEIYRKQQNDNKVEYYEQKFEKKMREAVNSMRRSKEIITKQASWN